MAKRQGETKIQLERCPSLFIMIESLLRVIWFVGISQKHSQLA